MKLNNFLKLVVVLFTSCNFNKKAQEVAINDAVTIEEISFPGGNGTSLPHLFSNKDTTILSWVKKINDSTTQFNYSYLINKEWTLPKEIITGKNWFVNWADYPSITENNGHLLAHHLKKSSKKTYAYDIKLNILPRGISQWQTEKLLHTDSTKTEHGFVTALPYHENSFFITWLDGRNTGNTEGAMTIRAAEVSRNGIVSANVLLDAKTCSCCQTTAAITDNGPIVLYRNRTDQEIRDIAITRHVDGKWTVPKPLYNDGWEINGCPVNGPKVDVIENNVVVAWFTAVGDSPKVQIIFSENGGADFSKPIMVNNSDTLGRVDIVLLDSDRAIVSWMETIENTTYLKAMEVNSKGEKSTPVTISVMGASRKTGFPQMERVGDNILFAWTVLDKEVSGITTAYVPLERF